MATNDRTNDSKLRFDPEKWEVVLPPIELERIKRSIAKGPNMQTVEHCHYAHSIDEMWRRSPVFYMKVPVSNKGEIREWPMGDVGGHLSIGIPVSIFQSRRVDEDEFDFVGSAITNEEDFLCPEVEIHNYSVQSRNGSIVMSNSTYRTIVSLWQQHFFETC